MRLIGVMCTSSNGFSRDILIDRARFIVFLNVIYYAIVLNDPFIIVDFSFTLTVVLIRPYSVTLLWARTALLPATASSASNKRLGFFMEGPWRNFYVMGAGAAGLKTSSAGARCG